MKITKQLKIAQTEVTLKSDFSSFEMQTPGRCILTVATDTAPSQGELLEINGKMAGHDMRRLFLGYVESVIQLQTGLFKIMGRELSAFLNRRIALNLRHVTPAQVLEEISKKTGLKFILPDSEWTKKTMARFQHIGGGYMALDSLLNMWQVENGVWQQQADGQVYIGESKKSVAGQKRIKLDMARFKSISVIGGTLPLAPRLRPGVQIEIAGQVFYVNGLEISGEEMRLKWQSNPWEKSLRSIQ